MPTVLLELPESLRGELKRPLGPIHTDPKTLLAEVSGRVIAVGDVVTAHLIRAGRLPDVALVDGRTERTAVDPSVTEAIGGFDRELTAENPAATLTAELVSALVDAIDGEGSAVVSVDGEEDLAALPAVLAAPAGAVVVYGQPGEGMVLAPADDDRRARCRELLARMDGDVERLFDILDR